VIQWDGGTNAVVTSLAQSGECHAGCTRLEEGAWAKHYDGTYSMGGIAITSDRGAQYYASWWSPSTGYQVSYLGPVGSAMQAPIGIEIHTFGQYTDFMDLSSYYYQTQVSFNTPIAANVYGYAQVGTRLFMPQSGTAVLPQAFFELNQWADSSANFYYQSTDGTPQYNITPAPQTLRWDYHPGDYPGIYNRDWPGGKLRSTCGPTVNPGICY